MDEERYNLKLNKRESEKHMRKLTSNISNKYGISVETNDKFPSGFGYTKCGIDGDFSIFVGSKMKTNNSLFNKKVNDIDFLKCICSLYHEEQHVIQNCNKYYDMNPDEDTIIMSLRKLASSENKNYYKGLNRYNNDLSEIEAEAIAISCTYDYIRDNFPEANANGLICELVNHKIQISDYFISGYYTSFDEILNAFSEHYENAKHKKVSYSAYELRPSQNINPKQDESIKFLQFYARENNDKQLIEKFNSTTEPHEKDLLIASITCHLHPEIDYERIYPCLKYIDLSPENVFDSSLPKAPEGLIKEIPKEDIKRRIETANSIHKRIVADEYSGYLKQSEITEHVDLSLLSDVKTYDKNKTYEP